MSPAQPLGNPAPIAGTIPASSAEQAAQRSLSLYVHIPYCSVRCGYCDFNTYAVEDFGQGVGKDTYANDALAELDFAVAVLEGSQVPARSLHSIFFGGGTPTQLKTADLTKILEHALDLFGLKAGAEITVEANPDSVTAEDLAQLAEAGFTRVSFGMQSAVSTVLAVLDRTHQPSNVEQVINWAKKAGLQTSLDLIYGAPQESLGQWQESLETALSYQPDHISAYSLIVEEGTKLWKQIQQGYYSWPDDDLLADMYLLADQLLESSGYHWYEVSNFASSSSSQSQHNKAYWKNQDWWGIGPGAHSHIAGTRWWNVKHPLAYSQRLAAGQSPAAAREVLAPATRLFEDIMLTIRTVEGVSVKKLGRAHPQKKLWQRLNLLSQQGLIEEALLDQQQRVILTRQGRLLADAVARQLVPDL